MAPSGYEIYLDVEGSISTAKEVFQSTCDLKKLQHHFDEDTFSGGVVFGSNKEQCHILIGKIEDGISNRHFAIDLNDDGKFVLVDTSTGGVKITYNKDERHEIQIKQSRTILPEDCKITIKVRSLSFSIRLPSENQAQRSSYLYARRKALPAIQSLNCHTQQHTEVAPSRATSPELNCAEQGDPHQGDLEEGDYIDGGPASAVVKLTNIRSKVTYAGKRSEKNSQEAWKCELDILKQLQHVSSPFLLSLFVY
jgi:hypothetical protein